MTCLVKINIISKFRQTKLVGRIMLISLILFAPFPFLCRSQNLYDFQQSQKYADYLFSSKQNTLAAEEYERLIFFDGNNISLKCRLIKSYRLSGNLISGINRIYSFWGDSLYSMPQCLATEYLKLQMLNDSSSAVEKFILKSNTLSVQNKSIYQSCNLLLNGKYIEAGKYEKTAVSDGTIFPADILLLTERAKKIKFKSPFVAASLSAIVPGTGKFYTKNWVDGVISLVFVASNAWQAHIGFKEKGSRSVYAWTFTTLSASFYIGNIFGAAKAARRYNKIKKNEIDNQVYEIVRSDSF